MNRPLLLIDIDGVISLFGFDTNAPPPGTFVTVDGILYFLSTVAGEQLIALGVVFELAWCSGWEEKADEYLPFALGLPAGLPHVALDLDLGLDLEAGTDGRHWKLAAIDRFAGPERPLAWIDDGHDHSCEVWAVQRSAPTLLISTDPAVGLTDAHARTLAGWAGALDQSNAP